MPKKSFVNYSNIIAILELSTAKLGEKRYFSHGKAVLFSGKSGTFLTLKYRFADDFLCGKIFTF